MCILASQSLHVFTALRVCLNLKICIQFRRSLIRLLDSINLCRFCYTLPIRLQIIKSITSLCQRNRAHTLSTSILIISCKWIEQSWQRCTWMNHSKLPLILHFRFFIVAIKRNLPQQDFIINIIVWIHHIFRQYVFIWRQKVLNNKTISCNEICILHP